MQERSSSHLQRRALAFLKRRAFAFLLCFAWVASGGGEVHAIERLIQLTNGAADPGASTTVYLRMSQVELFAGGDFEILYDPASISIIDVDRTSATDDFFLVDGNPSAGLLTISMAAAEAMAGLADVDIASIELQVLSGVPPGSVVPLVFRTARWYDENSTRHTYIGDNGLVHAGTSIPAEEPLELRIGTAESSPGTMVDIPLSLSIPEGAASVAMTIEYDTAVLENPVITLGEALAGWQKSTALENGLVSVTFWDSEGLSGIEAMILANCSFYVTGEATSGPHPIALTQGQVKNSQDFQYNARLSDGEITVQVVQETPTPTVTQGPTDTPTHSPADFNKDGVVNHSDLMQFFSTWHEEAGS